jgi:arginyl-tRNA synthetase
MKRRLEALLGRALADAIAGGALPVAAVPVVHLEVPREREHGDLASNVALALASEARMAPRRIADAILAHLRDPDGLLASAEVAGPGFLNFTFSRAFWHACLREADTLGDRYGLANVNAGRRFHVEFVSANPTGPLTVGHGRNAVLGDTLVRLLEATGAAVRREYYFNNAGRQMTLLGESTWARYAQLLGRDVPLPADGYQGDYIVAIAKDVRARDGDALTERDLPRFRKAAEEAIFADIRRTLDRMSIRFDGFVNEDALHREGRVADTLAALRAAGHVADRDGAVWLLGAGLGLDKDRVLVKSSGEPAYRLPDIAYHRLTLAGGYDLVVDVLGADHLDEHEEVLAALRGLGCDTSVIRAVIYQFVTLTRGSEQVKMSTRRAEYVTLDELLDEVGVDATRFFFVLRKSDSHLEFDLELAKRQSTDNPVYYVQYAHARIAGVLRQAAERGADVAGGGDPARLIEDEEIELVRRLAQFPDVVLGAARDLEPHRVAFYLLDFAGAFHRYYNRHRIVTDDPDLTRARLLLVRAAQRVMRGGLALLGVSAPERM